MDGMDNKVDKNDTPLILDLLPKRVFSLYFVLTYF